MMLSSVDMPLNSATFWKVRAMPWRTAWCGRMPARASPVEHDRALLRRVEAVDDVEHRGLAGTVGPDDGADLAGLMSKEMSVIAFTPPKDSETFARP